MWAEKRMGVAAEWGTRGVVVAGGRGAGRSGVAELRASLGSVVGWRWQGGGVGVGVSLGSGIAE